MWGMIRLKRPTCAARPNPPAPSDADPKWELLPSEMGIIIYIIQLDSMALKLGGGYEI